MDLVSIVIPVYNMGKSLAHCVNSIISQTYRNIEVILVDDGSSDNSYEVCLALAHNDFRIAVYHIENQGSGPARNYGIAHANGAFIYFPDADDYIEPHAIETLVNAANVSGSDLIVFGYKNIGTSGKVLSVKKYESKVFSGEDMRMSYCLFYQMTQPFSVQGAPWNKFFRMNVIRENRVLYPALRRHQDESFIARYMTYARQVSFINDVLYTYYTNDLKREWDKYPVDYIEAVKGLYEDRKHNLLIWNFEDKATHDQVQKEYICNSIKALELSFSPKYKFNIHERIAWIKNICANSELQQLSCLRNLRLYHKLALKCIQKGWCSILYLLLKIKVDIEKRQ